MAVLGLPIVCWIKVMRVGILVLLLILEEKLELKFPILLKPNLLIYLLSQLKA